MGHPVVDIQILTGLILIIRKFMAEYYKEFYTNDICKKEPGACEWIAGQVKKNAEYIRGMVVANSTHRGAIQCSLNLS